MFDIFSNFNAVFSMKIDEILKSTKIIYFLSYESIPIFQKYLIFFLQLLRS